MVELSELALRRLEGYAQSAKRIARQVLSPQPNVLDATGNTSADHAANLHVKAWKAQEKFRDKEIADPEQESKWVHASLWNEGRSVYRRRAGLARFRSREPVDPNVVDTNADPEERFFQKQAVAIAYARLAPREIDLLERFANNDYNIAATLRSYGSPVSHKFFSRLLADTQERAARFVHGRRDLGKVSGLGALYPDEEESEMSEKPECYGEMWEPFGESECVGCGLKHECLDTLAKGYYPAKLESLKAAGKDPTIQNLSVALGINAEATLAVQQYVNRLPIVAPTQPELPPEPPSKPDDILEKPPVEMWEPRAAEPPKAVPDFKEIDEMVTQESGAAVAFTEANQPEESDVAATKKTKAKPKVQKPKAAKKPKKAAEIQAVPPAAGPAQTAAEPATTRKGSKQSAKSAKASAGSSAKKKKRKSSGGGKRTWGKHTFHTRWLRERERNPLVAVLTPGTKLRREYQGQMVEVKVLAGYYVWNGEEYPTLQAATTAATGAKEYPKQEVDGERAKGVRKMGNWSANKFWKLKEVGKGKSE